MSPGLAVWEKCGLRGSYDNGKLKMAHVNKSSVLIQTPKALQIVNRYEGNISSSSPALILFSVDVIKKYYNDLFCHPPTSRPLSFIYSLCCSQLSFSQLQLSLEPAAPHHIDERWNTLRCENKIKLNCGLKWWFFLHARCFPHKRQTLFPSRSYFYFDLIKKK